MINVRRMQLNWPTPWRSYSMKNNCFSVCTLMTMRRNRPSCTFTVPFGMHTFNEHFSTEPPTVIHATILTESCALDVFLHRPLYYLKIAINLNKYPLTLNIIQSILNANSKTEHFIFTIVSFHESSSRARFIPIETQPEELLAKVLYLTG